jgi:hypothetical protein
MIHTPRQINKTHCAVRWQRRLAHSYTSDIFALIYLPSYISTVKANKLDRGCYPFSRQTASNRIEQRRVSGVSQVD